MAYFGATTPIIAKLTADTPTYEDGFECGEAMEITLEPQTSEANLYGNNRAVNSINRFRALNVTLGVTRLPKEAYEVMFGRTVGSTGGVTFKSTDVPNYVGMGFVTMEEVDGLTKYVPYWLYKVKFTPPSSGATSIGDSITFNSPSITGTAIALASGVYQDFDICDTEADAIEWLKEKADMSTDVGG